MSNKLMNSENKYHINIGFIGAGKVGVTLGMYFVSKGIHVKGYYSRTYDSALNGAKRVDTKAFEKVDDLLDDLDFLFVTTNDDSIEVIDKMLVESHILDKECVIIHTSGVHTSSTFKLLSKTNPVASVHPLQSFADIDGAFKVIKYTPFTLEGDDVALIRIGEVMKIIGNKYFEISKEQKPLYHGGACIVSNYLVTLMDYGLKFFEAAGLNREVMFEAVKPLIEGTLENILEKGTVNALTGPLVRGDKKTIISHVETGEKFIPDELELYRVLGQKTLEMINEKRLEEEKVNELEEILRRRYNE